MLTENDEFRRLQFTVKRNSWFKPQHFTRIPLLNASVGAENFLANVTIWTGFINELLLWMGSWDELLALVTKEDDTNWLQIRSVQISTNLCCQLLVANKIEAQNYSLHAKLFNAICSFPDSGCGMHKFLKHWKRCCTRESHTNKSQPRAAVVWSRTSAFRQRSSHTYLAL